MGGGHYNLFSKLREALLGKHTLQVVDAKWKFRWIHGPSHDYSVGVMVYDLFEKFKCSGCGGVKEERSGRVVKYECECGWFLITSLMDGDVEVSNHLDENHNLSSSAEEVNEVMSSEEPDLPVAVRCMREQNGYPDLESTAIGRSILKEGDELTKVSVAEEVIKEAREEAYNKGFKEATQEATEILLEELEEPQVGGR